MDDWKWYAGSNNEFYRIGPCDTKEESICVALNEDVGSYGIIHIVEACNPRIMLSEWIPDNIIELSEENIYDSGRCNSEYDDGAVFECSAEQEEDLMKSIRLACDEWQSRHKVKFYCATFTKTRNAETIQ